MALQVTYFLTLSWSVFSDLENRKIPESLLLFSAICGWTLTVGDAGWTGLVQFPLFTILGLAVSFLLFVLGALGGGDGKLLALSAGYFGLKVYRRLLWFSLLTGAGYGLICILRRLRRGERGRTKFCFSGAILAGYLCHLIF